MTYYLPGKAGSHDFKFGFEDIYDSYHFGINGQSGPYRLSYPCQGRGAGSHPLHRHRRAGRLQRRLDGRRQHRSALLAVRAGSLGVQQPACR